MKNPKHKVGDIVRIKKTNNNLIGHLVEITQIIDSPVFLYYAQILGKDGDVFLREEDCEIANIKCPEYLIII